VVDEPSATDPQPLEGSGANGDGGVLVVGDRASLSGIGRQMTEATRVFSYSHEASLALSAEGIVSEHISVLAHVREIDRLVWEWASDVAARLSADQRFQPELLRLIRRSFASRTLIPIAQAQAAAREVHLRAPGAGVVLAHGISEIERLALSEFFTVRAFHWGEARGGSFARDAGDGSSRWGVIARVLTTTVLDAAQFVLCRLPVPRSSSSQRRVAVFAKYPSHLRLLSSTMQTLSDRGWECVVVDMSADGSLSSDRWSVELRFWDYCRPNTVSRLLRRRANSRRLSGGQFVRWVGEAGLGPYLDRLARDFSERYSVRAPAAIEAHRRIARRLRSTVALTVNETVLEVEAVTVAREETQVPAANVQHGIITSTKRRAEFHFDAFCVFGQAYAEHLVESGTDRSRIRVVGNPLMDEYASLDEGQLGAIRARVRRDLSLPEADFVLLFAAQYFAATPSDDLNHEVLSMLLLVMKDEPDMQLVIKWHPLGAGMEDGYLHALSAHGTDRVTEVRDCDLNALIVGVDAVATYSSTTGFEAATLRRPTIVLNPTGREEAVPFVREGTALKASNADELREAIHSIRQGSAIPEERYEELDRKYNFGHDGHAGARIADVCEELARAAGGGTPRQAV